MSYRYYKGFKQQKLSSNLLSLGHSRSLAIMSFDVKVIVSHVHFKSGSISGTELDRDTVTTGRDIRPT